MSACCCSRRAARHGGELHVPAMFPLAFKSEPRLGSVRRGGAWARRTPALLPARPRDRRLELDQRDDLPARQPRRLRRVGCERRGWLVVRRGAPVLQALGGQRARRERVPRRGRAPRRVRQPLDDAVHRGAARGCRVGGVRAHRRPERRPAGGRLSLPAHAAQRHAVQRGRRLPPSGRERAEPRSDGPASSSSASSSRATAPSASSSSRTASARRFGPSAR